MKKTKSEVFAIIIAIIIGSTLGLVIYEAMILASNIDKHGLKPLVESLWEGSKHDSTNENRN